MTNYLGDLYAILTAFSWSFGVIFMIKSSPFIKIIPLKTFHNFIAAALFFFSILIFDEPLTLDLTIFEWAKVIVSAILGITIADTLFIFAMTRIGASLQAIVDSLYMPFVMFLAYTFFGENLHLQVLIGAGLVISAVVMIHLREKHPHLSKRDLTIGIITAIAAQFSMAICIVMLKDILHKNSILTLTAYRFLIGSIVLTLIYLRRYPNKELFQGFKWGPHWKVTFPGAFFGPYLATLLWFAGFKYTLAGRAAVYNQLSTVIIVVLAVIFLKEKMSHSRLLALVMAMMGSLLVFTSPS